MRAVFDGSVDRISWAVYPRADAKSDCAHKCAGGVFPFRGRSVVCSEAIFATCMSSGSHIFSYEVLVSVGY